MKMKSMRLMSRVTAALCLAALGLSQAPRASADMLVADTTLILGSEAATYSFTAPTSGTITAQLTNLPYPERLSSLSFMATTASDVLSSWSADTSETASFQVGPGTYFAHILATATGPLNLGLYSLTLSFTPSAVPLPASDWLLVIGSLGLFVLARVQVAVGPWVARVLRSMRERDSSHAQGVLAA